jgi:DNA repair exonuclease SbcCD nuclease subunit
VKNIGFTFALLGGEHIANITSANQSICTYPGTPEPLNQSEENGLHQIVSINFSGQDYMLQTYEVQQWHYRVVQLDITKYSSNEDTARQISNLLEKENQKSSRSAISVELKGHARFDLNLFALRELIQSNVFYRLENHISMSYDIEQLAHEQTVRGLLVKNFQERINRAMTEFERYQELTALNIALQALEGKQVSLYEIKEN